MTNLGELKKKGILKNSYHKSNDNLYSIYDKDIQRELNQTLKTNTRRNKSSFSNIEQKKSYFNMNMDLWSFSESLELPTIDKKSQKTIKINDHVNLVMVESYKQHNLRESVDEDADDLICFCLTF